MNEQLSFLFSQMISECAIWVSLFASTIQSTYYGILLNATGRVVDEFEDINEPHLATLYSIKPIKQGLGLGLLLGFGITWPIGDFVGRRNGLLCSNLLLALGIFCQWTSSRGNFAVLSFLTGACIGASTGLQTGLYYLYIHETRPRGWAAASIALIFLAKSLISFLAVCSTASKLRRQPVGPQQDDDTEGSWSVLLTFGLLPAGIQTGALLCCVESPGWTGIQAGNPAKAQADEKRLSSYSASDLEKVEVELVNGDMEKVPKVRGQSVLQLAVVSLAFVSVFSSNQFHTDSYLLTILNTDGALNGLKGLLHFLLFFLFLILAWATLLSLRTRLSGRGLVFGSLVGLILSSFVRILLVLIPLSLGIIYSYSDRTSRSLKDEWLTTTAWLVYLIDELAAPLSGLLVTSVVILVMELAEQRDRARNVSFLLLCIFMTLMMLGGPVNIVTPELLTLRRNLGEYYFLPRDVSTLLLKWSVQLGLNLLLALGAGVLWQNMKHERFNKEQ